MVVGLWLCVVRLGLGVYGCDCGGAFVDVLGVVVVFVAVCL